MPCRFLHASKDKRFKCNQCGQGYVPEIIITTLEPIEGIEYIGEPMYLEAKVVKMKRNEKGEGNAIHVSEKILFTEYYLHSQIVTKMKIFSMNALFSFKVKITVGETFIFGVAQATALRLVALPLPSGVEVRLKKKQGLEDFKNNAENVELVSKCYSQISKIAKIRQVYEYDQCSNDIAALLLILN